jgi:hypothetical protein
VPVVAALYVLWLGAHWLPLPPSSEEIPLYASRIWDMQHEIARSGHVTWWTSTFMMGSSNALPYASFPLVPWFFLAKVFGLMLPGKLLVLASTFACGPSMYYLARRFVGSDLGATFAALAYMLHPHVLAAGTSSEHVSVVMFMALLPLGWLTLARALESGRFPERFACATTFMLLAWTQNKLTTVQAPFLVVYALWDFARAGRGHRSSRVWTLASTLGLTIVTSAFFLVPSLSEMSLMKLFEGDPFDGWQQMYSLTNLTGLFARERGEGSYFGIALGLVCVAAVFGAKKRANASLFALLVAFSIACVTLGHGPKTVGLSMVRWYLGDVDRHWTDATYWTIECAVMLVLGGMGAFFLRKRVTSLWGRIFAIAGVVAFWLVPCFDLLASLPLFKQIRAPEIFSQEPLEIFGALLAGFFVTDVIEPRLGSKVAVQRGIVAAMTCAMVFDAWPFGARARASDLSQGYADRLRAIYERLGAEAATEGGRVLTATGSALHLMGPSWGGPPMVNEGHLRYMAPRGSGVLQATSTVALALERPFLDMAGAHWLVVDKNVPWTASQLDWFRQTYPVEISDEDHEVFHVSTARPYLSGYAHQAAYYGEPAHLPNLALLLASSGYLLVDGPPGRLQDKIPEELARFAALYVETPPEGQILREIGSKTYLVQGDRPPPMPPSVPNDDALDDVVVHRPAAQRIESSFTAKEGCVAVFAESYYPYWKATLDGHRTEIVKAATGFIGVEVTAGPHEITLNYEPPAEYSATMAASLFAILLGAAKTWTDLRARRAGAASAATA